MSLTTIDATATVINTELFVLVKAAVDETWSKPTGIEL